MGNASMRAEQISGSAVPHLRRVLGLWDLIYYGMVTVSPIAPVTVFGLALTLSLGHAVDTILTAMVAMILTAFSYGRMAALYPSAGSAYTYVGRGLNPHLGFLAGWAMLLDYLVIPVFCVIFGSLSAQRLVPGIPYPVFVLLFTGVITFLNLRGIRSVALANQILLAFMGGVFLVFVVLALRFLFSHEGWSGIFSLQPMYNPATFSVRAVAAGTSFAALNYLGFDSVTTLAEDVQNPRRNVLLATVLVCLFTGIFSSLIIYLGQRVWPDYQTFAHIETAFMEVTRRVGGAPLFLAMAIVVVVAVLGSALAAQAGASRLLFGFGRDNVLPRSLFARLDPKRSSPTFNIWFIGLVALVGSFLLNYEIAAEVLNFGAFLGFMGVNIAVIHQYYMVGRPGHKKSLLTDAIVPGLGFLFCFGIWWGLQRPAKIAGGAWFLAGILYDAIRTRGFRLRPVMLDFDES
jgi:amino acid transporter